MKENRLCLALTEKTLNKNIELIKKYKNFISMLELRADFLNSEELSGLDKFPKMTDLPVILTIRRKKEGGTYTGSEIERTKLLSHTVSSDTNKKYAFVDLEDDFHNAELEKSIYGFGIRIIRSIHDTKGIPENLADILKGLKQRPDDIPKAAVTPKSTRGLIKLIKLYKEMEGEEKILLGMGSFGFITRILAPALGSYLSYVSASDSSQAAPGHIDPETMQTLYRYKNISKNTKIYGVIGNPIMHSFSPKIHNKGFIKLGMDAVYLPIHIDKIDDYFILAELLDIQGISITIPHKQAIIPFLKHSHESVDKIGACNTMHMFKQEGWTGYNSDAWGFMEPIHNILKKSMLSEKKATVIGAGGAARAIVYILRRENISVLILNRTEKKAEALAKEFGCSWGALNSENIKKAYNFNDIVIQTTNVGMHPNTEQDPFTEYKFCGNEIFYDIIYNPTITKLMKRAINSGCKVIYGKEMLINQALKQFFLFTGNEFPCKNDIIEEFEKY